MDPSSIYHSVSSIQVIRLAVGYEEWRVEAHGQIKDALKVGQIGSFRTVIKTDLKDMVCVRRLQEEEY